MKLLAVVAIASGLFVGGCINKAHAIAAAGIAISSAARGHVSGSRPNEKLICNCEDQGNNQFVCECLRKSRYDFVKRQEALQTQKEKEKKEQVRLRMEPYIPPPPRELTEIEQRWADKAKGIVILKKEGSK